MRASDRTVESSTEAGELWEVLLVDVLREGGELAFGVRLRIAVDVLEEAANRGAEMRPRAREGGLRLEGVKVDSEGVGHHRGEGTRGSAEVAWEILAGRPLRGEPVPLRKVADDVSEAVDALISRALARDGVPGDSESFVAALEDAGRDWLDTHEDVRQAMGFDRDADNEEVAVSVAPSSLERILPGATGQTGPKDTRLSETSPEKDGQLLPPPSPAATPALEPKDLAAPVSARATPAEDAGLLEQVDEAWPTTSSTKPPPLATENVEAKAPVAAAPAEPVRARTDSIPKLGDEDTGEAETRVRSPKQALLRASRPSDRPTPDEPTRPLLAGADIDDPTTPDEPTLLNPKSWRFMRPVIPSSLVRTPAETAALRSPVASDPGLRAESGKPIKILDEDSDDVGPAEEAEEDEQTSLYKKAGNAAHGRNRIKATSVAPPASTRDAARPSSRAPGTDEDGEEERESGRAEEASRWPRTMIIAFLVGGLLALAAIEISARFVAPLTP